MASRRRKNAAPPAEAAGAGTGEKEECVICLDVPTVRGKLNSCNHMFCFDCIEKWGKDYENTCPLCKKRFQHIKKVRGLECESLPFVRVFE